MLCIQSQSNRVWLFIEIKLKYILNPIKRITFYFYHYFWLVGKGLKVASTLLKITIDIKVGST